MKVSLCPLLQSKVKFYIMNSIHFKIILSIFYHIEHKRSASGSSRGQVGHKSYILKTQTLKYLVWCKPTASLGWYTKQYQLASSCFLQYGSLRGFIKKIRALKSKSGRIAYSLMGSLRHFSRYMGHHRQKVAQGVFHKFFKLATWRSENAA